MTKRERKELIQAVGVGTFIALLYVRSVSIWDWSFSLLLIFFALYFVAGWGLAVLHEGKHQK